MVEDAVDEVAAGCETGVIDVVNEIIPAETIFSEGVLAQSLARHPDIRLDLSVDDTGTDIVKEGFDAGIQLGEVIFEDMVAVNITHEERQIVVASPRYLAKYGTPKRPRDLHRHACIGWRVYSRPAPYRRSRFRVLPLLPAPHACGGEAPRLHRLPKGAARTVRFRRPKK